MDPLPSTSRSWKASFPLVLALFFVSGGSGLVYEVLWTRRLTLLFGSGLFATSAVLATFMGGLALGSWLLGKTADRWASPFALYGWLEIGLGLYALALPVILALVLPVYQWAYRSWNGDALAVNVSRVVLSAAIFLVPCFLMGGTLPALSRLVVRSDSGVGGRIGRLYAFNTWGAVVGCAIAGLLLIELLGIRGAELLAIAANLSVGTLAVILARGAGSGAALESPPPAPEGSRTTVAPRRLSSAQWLTLAALGASGFAALGYEVIWTRYLTFFLGNSTYAFSAMLGSFLVGLALGAVVAARVVDRLEDPFGVFGWVELLVGASMVAGVGIYSRMNDVIAFVCSLIPGDAWTERALARMGVAFLVLFVPTFFLGTTFPIAGRLFVSSASGVGSQVGLLYASNTIGAIVGSLCAGLALIPVLGFRNAVICLVCVNAAITAALSFRSVRRPYVLFACAAILVVGAFLALPRELYLATIQRAFPQEKIIYYRENPSSTIFVTRTPENERWVYFSDNRGSGGTLNLPGHRMWGHLPSILCRNRETACVICFGSGITLGSVASHPFKKIVCAEICENIGEAGRFFPENHAALEDPRVRLVTDDGRNVLLGTSETFDVIVSEPPLLETAGVVNLFTRDFYEVVKPRLSPGGVFCQWVPSGEFTREQNALVIRTFLDAFPNATYWNSPLYYDTLLIGTLGPQRFDLAEIERRMAEPRVRQDLEESAINGPLELLSWFVLSPRSLAAYCGTGPIMTDDKTMLDFQMPRTVPKLPRQHTATFWKRRQALPPGLMELEVGESIAPLVDWPRDGSTTLPSRLESIERSKRLVMMGHQAALDGDMDRQARLYDEGLAADPEFTTARYYAGLNRVERAEAAADAGNATLAGTLASEARPLVSQFVHLERRIDALERRERASR